MQQECQQGWQNRTDEPWIEGTTEVRQVAVSTESPNSARIRDASPGSAPANTITTYGSYSHQLYRVNGTNSNSGS